MSEVAESKVTMGSEFACWCISISVLLALLSAEAGNVRKMIGIQHMEESMGKNKVQQTSMDDHMDPSVNIFFKIDDLKVGKTMAIYLASKNFSAYPHLLSREEADSIPFSSTKLPQILDLFSISKHSPQAKAMEYTLTQCEVEPTQGETRFCATSLESMLDFAKSVLGLRSGVKVLTTTFLKTPSVWFQNYNILDMPKQVMASKIIGCHTLPYPYAVFYCHSQQSETKLFQISLGGEDGDRVVEAPAVCHMDTLNGTAIMYHFACSKLSLDHPQCAISSLLIIYCGCL